MKCETLLSGVQCIKVQGVIITSHLKFSEQCIDTANKANRMPGFIKKNFLWQNKDVLLPCNSLCRPHLEYTAQFWSPHQVNDITKLGVQHLVEMIPYLHSKPCDVRISNFNFTSFEKPHLKGKLIICFEILNPLMHRKFQQGSVLPTMHFSGPTSLSLPPRYFAFPDLFYPHRYIIPQ